MGWHNNCTTKVGRTQLVSVLLWAFHLPLYLLHLFSTAQDKFQPIKNREIALLHQPSYRWSNLFIEPVHSVAMLSADGWHAQPIVSVYSWLPDCVVESPCVAELSRKSCSVACLRKLQGSGSCQLSPKDKLNAQVLTTRMRRIVAVYPAKSI